MRDRIMQPDSESHSAARERIKAEGNVWREHVAPLVAACEPKARLRKEGRAPDYINSSTWVEPYVRGLPPCPTGDTVYVAIPMQAWQALVDALAVRP